MDVNNIENENDKLIATFLGTANGILDKFLEEASKKILNEGLLATEAALVRIEATINASTEIRLQVQTLSGQVINGLSNGSKTTAYFNQLAVQLETYVNLTPDKIALVRAGVIDLASAQARVLKGQALDLFRVLTGATNKVFFALETLVLVDALYAGDNREAAASSVGTLVGLGVGSLASAILGTGVVVGTVAAAFGALAGLLTTSAFKLVIGDEDYAAFISTISNLAEDILIEQVRLNNGVELDVGNEILHQILLKRIDNTVTPQTSDEIVQAASIKPEKGVESTIKALEKLINGTSSNTAITDNDTYFNRAIELFTAIRTPLGKIQSVGSAFLSTLIMQAKQNSPLGMATRYALQEINSFIITGNQDIYDQHNLDHSLELYDPATGLGMTAKYIEDRAAFLTAKISMGLSNTLFHEVDVTQSDKRKFIQLAPGGSVVERADEVGKGLLDFSTNKNIIFGSDVSDRKEIFSTSAYIDHVYGGGGIDTIFGQAGDDYIEGNADDDVLVGGEGADKLYGGNGNDTLWHADNFDTSEDNAIDILEGGNGNDTYHVGLGDTILDSDKTGRVFYQGDILWGGLIEPGSTDSYLSTDNRYTYKLLNGVLTIDVAGKTGQITIQNFTSGDLGIELFEIAPAELSLTPMKLLLSICPVLSSTSLTVQVHSYRVNHSRGL